MVCVSILLAISETRWLSLFFSDVIASGITMTRDVGDLYVLRGLKS